MRLLLVSNRLPVTVQGDGVLKYQESVGGLASGLRTYINQIKKTSKIDYVWIGWPGIEVDERNKAEVKSRLEVDFRSHPIFLSEKPWINSTMGFVIGLYGLFSIIFRI
jgi:trehalose-6-phosphate synthase